MFSDNTHKMKEEAHVGEELLNGNPLSEIDRKCLTVKQVVQDGDFTLDEALGLYQVSKSDYESFAVRSIVGEIDAVFMSVSGKEKVSNYIMVMAKMYKHLLINIDHDAAMILAHFDTLAKEVDQGKIAV